MDVADITTSCYIRRITRSARVSFYNARSCLSAPLGKTWAREDALSVFATRCLPRGLCAVCTRHFLAADSFLVTRSASYAL